MVIDEVQRMSALLNEVHAMITDYGKRYRSAMTGSSARKLRRLDINMLAGRAITRHFFPLTVAELDYAFDIDALLAHGCLPHVRSEPELAVAILEAYVGTYLREEIQQEALMKDRSAFEIAPLHTIDQEVVATERGIHAIGGRKTGSVTRHQ